MARTITIYNSVSQQKTVVENVEANTLGELKAILSSKGININGMSILEGVSNTQLLNDDSQLPSNIRYRDAITNDLMLYLTPSKKVASGVCGKEQLLEGLDLICRGANIIKHYYESVSEEESQDSNKGFSLSEIEEMKKKFSQNSEEEEAKKGAEIFNKLCQAFFRKSCCDSSSEE
jgi:hypothetical protein